MRVSPVAAFGPVPVFRSVMTSFVGYVAGRVTFGLLGCAVGEVVAPAAVVVVAPATVVGDEVAELILDVESEHAAVMSRKEAATAAT